MIDDFGPLESELARLFSRLEPRKRVALNRRVAKDLRDANLKRIRGNVQPDGAPMQPRKAAGGALRAQRMRAGVPAEKKGKMFKRARKVLRAQGNVNDAIVGFHGAAARIMGVHQYGQRDAVSQQSGAPNVVYPQRTLLGLSEEDREQILKLALDLLAG